MDNHPIPQDVTGFQFKLIGSMTVKQFSYVALGVIIAVVLYYLPINILIKIIFIPFFGGSGFVIAFLPIEGRPVDSMLGNFIKSFFTPTQYVYHKTPHSFSFARVSSSVKAFKPSLPSPTLLQDKQKRLQAALQSAHISNGNKLDQKEQAFLQTITSSQTTPPATAQPASVLPQKPTPQSLEQEEKILTQQLSQAKQDEQNQQQPVAQSAAHQRAALLEKQIQALHAQRQQLDKELTALQQQLSGAQTTPSQIVISAPATNTTPPPVQTPSQNIQEITKKAGLPHVPDIPNIIVGIVKDPRGNVLPNMLVEVKDKDGSPVRAFKTNLLGQFASATPLAVGIYTVEIEDPKKLHSFEVIQINANNQILVPIEITSHDAREELRKQLFN